MAAADQLAQGSLEAAERSLALAGRHSGSGPAGRGEYGRLLPEVVRLLLDRQRGDLPAVAADARELQAMTEVADAAQPGLGADLSALALISLGSTQYFATSSADAERCLERGIVLARHGRRPYLEFTGLAYQTSHEFYHSFARGVQRARQALELAEQHGWTDDPAVGIACSTVAAALTFQGQPDEAEPWVRRAERILMADTQPVAVLGIRLIRGMLELERDRNAAAALQLAEGDPRAALAALAPVQENPVAEDHWGFWQARADVLEAIARDALGDPDAADAAIERALDLSERSGDMTPFLLYPASGLLERHARHRTAHAALVAEIRGLAAGAGPAGREETAGGHGGRSPHAAIVPARPAEPLLEPLSGGEVRVLPYLPTNLTAPEIARELSVSPNTVKTHIRHMYAKFGAHHRTEVVELARTLGLLAPSRTGPVSRATR